MARSERRRITLAVSREAIRSFQELSPARRLQWLEEMIRLQAALPARVRKLLDRHRALSRRPANR